VSKPTRVLLLTKYGQLGASSRLRMLQYVPLLEQAGLEVRIQSLMPDTHLQARYESGAYSLMPLLQAYWSRIRAMLGRQHFDLLWIEKEALPWWPLWFEKALLQGVPYALDYDDAIFHNYDQHRQAWVRRVYGRRLDGLMAGAALVVGGNQYLARRAVDAGARRVEVVPTAIDLLRYPTHAINKRLARAGSDATPPRVVWIGSPSTVGYLDLLHEPLRELARRQRFIFRVIGGGAVTIPGVEVEVVPWSLSSEVSQIRECDVGVMPLHGSLWDQGKCGYKLIQYMACAMPVVASNAGVNPEIVEQGISGYLASSPDQWVDALRRLLNDKTLQRSMGKAGRMRVEQSYCIQKTAPKLIGHIRATALAR